MVDFHRLKNLGTDILGRAGEVAEQAKDKVAPLAEQAKDRVAPLAEQAKDKVAPLAGKAKGAAAKGVDKATAGLDSATGGKFHDNVADVAGNRDESPSTAADPARAADPAATVDPADTADPSGVSDPQPSTDATVDAEFADVLTDAPVIQEPIAEPEPTDPIADDAGHSELLIVTDDGSLHHPTPADMPQHRAADDPS